MGEALDIKKLAFEPNRVIFEEGAIGDNVYLVTSGTVELRHHGGGEAPFTLEVLGRGDIFGEMALFTDERRIATAVASAPTEVIAISGEEFRKRLKAVDPVILSAIRAMAKRLSRMTEAMAERGGDVSSAGRKRKPGA